MDPKEISEAVRARRLELGLTQDELARLAGVQVSTVHDYERPARARGKRRPLVARRMAGALGWKPEAFDLMLAGTDPRDVVASSDAASSNGGGDVGEQLDGQVRVVLDAVRDLAEQQAALHETIDAITQMQGGQMVQVHRLASAVGELQARLAEYESRLDEQNR